MAEPGRPAHAIRAPRGTTLSCQGWPQEAALRMLMNNLDPDVAERWEDLVVYGGSGKAARELAGVSPDRRDAAAARARRDAPGPVGQARRRVPHPSRRAARAHRQRAARARAGATGSTSGEYEAMGLTMYGQMTAGSWIYIGTQGILQGTYETFGACARTHFGGSLAGRLVLSAGLGGMGGAQPLAVTLNGGVGLFVEVDRERIERRLRLRYVDRVAASLDEALGWAEEARARREPLSIALHGNAAEVHPELARRGVRFDVVTDQTAAHDMMNGYVPAGLSVAEAAALRGARAEGVPAARVRVDRRPDAGDARVPARGRRSSSTTATTSGARPRTRGSPTSAYPGLRPRVHPPALLRGQGPFRWVALSGDPEDIHATDRALMEAFAGQRASWSAGCASRRSASASRGCRRASAGSATATGPRPGGSSTTSSPRAG